MKQIVILLSALFLAALTGGALAGQFYKWTDKDGNVSYHDKPPPFDTEYEYEKRVVRGDSLSNEDLAMQRAAKENPVVLYSVKKCASCDVARMYLRKRKVPFTEKNVGTDRELQKEVLEKTGSLAVPVITVGARVMNGFMESLLDGELNQAGYPKPNTDEAAGEGQDAKY